MQQPLWYAIQLLQVSLHHWHLYQIAKSKHNYIKLVFPLILLMPLQTKEIFSLLKRILYKKVKLDVIQNDVMFNLNKWH